MCAVLIPNLLLIAGTGQNAGKTALACNIVQQFSGKYPIIAIKISSHFHKNVESGNIIIQRDDLYIAEEIDNSKTKDSARMLAAGARKSYFVMVSDDQLLEAVETILKICNTNDYIICESGGLRKYMIPGVFLMLHRAGSIAKPGTEQLKTLCDRWVTFDGNQFDFSINQLEISNNAWHLKE